MQNGQAREEDGWERPGTWGEMHGEGAAVLCEGDGGRQRGPRNGFLLLPDHCLS